MCVPVLIASKRFLVRSWKICAFTAHSDVDMYVYIYMENAFTANYGDVDICMNRCYVLVVDTSYTLYVTQGSNHICLHK